MPRLSTLLLLVAAALALLFARDAYEYVAHPLARGMRLYSLTWLALLLSAAAWLVLLAWLPARAATTSLKWFAWAVPAVLALPCASAMPKATRIGTDSR
jgi:hypothetical protein